MWEVFTCGKMPYGRLKNAEVVERVQRGIVLERPLRCPEKIYAVRSNGCIIHLFFLPPGTISRLFIDLLR